LSIRQLPEDDQSMIITTTSSTSPAAAANNFQPRSHAHEIPTAAIPSSSKMTLHNSQSQGCCAVSLLAQSQPQVTACLRGHTVILKSASWPSLCVTSLSTG
jgi:hypothetical protein